MFLVIGFDSGKRSAEPVVVYVGNDGAKAKVEYDKVDDKFACKKFFKNPIATRRRFYDAAAIKAVAEAKVKADAEAEAQVKADEEAKAKVEVGEPSLIPADVSETKKSDKPSGGKPAKLKK